MDKEQLASLVYMRPELPEDAEVPALAPEASLEEPDAEPDTPDPDDTAEADEDLEDPDEPKEDNEGFEWSARDKRWFAVAIIYAFICLPGMMFLGVQCAKALQRGWGEYQIEDYFDDSAIIEDASLTSGGDFLHGYYLQIEARLAPGVSDQDVCELLVGADKRFGKAKLRSIGKNELRVRLTGDIPSHKGELFTYVPFTGSWDGFTRKDGGGVCTRELHSVLGG
ncbi:Uncharacterised protein [Actinomyces bovis]|uniref:Uncharacterized protein n=1 Tax=Actinomyces bovis TaxID=1658 RepID=A0ABY1VRN4_9ACTO|nr:hypothetical protein [Actinomyces bovis]SPT55035.1 Uncharacterised protein [Actinomyces bovis]VEG56190.1 Uncharacterised protein [Actinomyces israelii]